MLKKNKKTDKVVADSLLAPTAPILQSEYLLYFLYYLYIFIIFLYALKVKNAEFLEKALHIFTFSRIVLLRAAIFLL